MELSLPILVVDLDGTLIQTDMLHELAIRLIRDRPLHVLRIPFWLFQGKVVLKRRLAESIEFDPFALPWNDPLLKWLQEQRAKGRRLVLCTAADSLVAGQIAKHLDIFDEVMASDGVSNLAGKTKAETLLNRFGAGGFDYVANSSADLAVWKHARRAIVVNASAELAGRVARLCEVEKKFSAPEAGIRAWRRVLRVHQWLKNLLLFVPLIAAHQIANLQNWAALALAFAAFCLCSSSVYIANDLLDLESDRHHPRKRHRPFASGLVPAWAGVAVAPLLLLASLAIAWYVDGNFLPWMVFYFVLTCTYSWGLKRLMIVDCLTLALLYTLRIVAGAAAVNLPLSFWLLAFAVFLFLSLAFVKRYAELETQMLSGKQKTHGRGYYTSDATLVQTLGVTAGYAAVLVLALYLNSDAVVKLYRSPEIIWGTVPVMLFWVSWMWMQAHRGKMHDDPLIFALKDKASLLAGIALVVVLIAGAKGSPW